MGIKIFLAQQNYHIGNFESNTKKIIEAVKTAKEIKINKMQKYTKPADKGGT